MISRVFRFHGHGSLNYLYRNGKVQRVEFLTLRYVKGRQEDFRLSVIVSKKVSKSAVVRNRIRRRIYEIIRTLHKESGATWPYDMSITVFDERVEHLPHDELQSLVQKLLAKAEIAQ